MSPRSGRYSLGWLPARLTMVLPCYYGAAMVPAAPAATGPPRRRHGHRPPPFHTHWHPHQWYWGRGGGWRWCCGLASQVVPMSCSDLQPVQCSQALSEQEWGGHCCLLVPQGAPAAPLGRQWPRQPPSWAARPWLGDGGSGLAGGGRFRAVAASRAAAWYCRG